MFFLFTVIACIIYYYFYIQTYDVFNPPGIMIFSWLFLAGVSQLNLGVFQRPWILFTYFAIALSAGTMFLTGAITLGITNRSGCVVKVRRISKLKTIQSNSNNYDFNKYYNSNRFFYIFAIWMLVCFFASLFGIYENGLSFTHIFTHELHGNKGGWIKSSFVFVEYFANMLPYCSNIALFDYLFTSKTTRKRKYFDLFIIVYSFAYVVLVMASRGTALVQLLGMIFIMHRKKNFRLKELGFYIVIILLMFGGFALIRWSINSGATFVVFSGKINIPIVNAIYNYIAYCYQNLDTLFRIGSPYTIYKFEFQSIERLFGSYNPADLIYIEYQGFNAATFIFGAYHDLGIIGIFLISIIDVFFVTSLYKKSKHDEAYSMILAMFQKGIMTLFFGDFIFVLNTTYLPAVLLFFLLKFSKKRNVSGDIELNCC